MHLSPEFGLTVKAIETDGFEIVERVEMLLSSDSPDGIAKSIGLGTIGFGQAFARSRPDLLLVLGDRFEMFAAVLAALPFKIPVAHIHGGEVTQGAIDDALRHSITKLSHLHFASVPEYARRIEQLGEEPWRITVSGAVGLDNLREVPLLTPAELEDQFGLRLEPPPLLVTFHPVTLEYQRTSHHIEELMAALDELALPVVFTLPNADTSGRIIHERISQYIKTRPATRLVENLGTQGYFSLMSHAAAMVGNSSSGIIEAPSFKLPVVNIGSRQTGRVRAANVIDVGYERSEIVRAVRLAVSTDFRAGLQSLTNPYEKGGAAETIVSRLKAEDLNEHLVCKVFHDLSE
jgi:UDP-N-acetylglucosamine 2-epimerase (non-hydrolysing)/GDP/UDP-N,N'-diacetylbacillosamine 2-epimerase (hydrolysing)